MKGKSLNPYNTRELLKTFIHITLNSLLKKEFGSPQDADGERVSPFFHLRWKTLPHKNTVKVWGNIFCPPQDIPLSGKIVLHKKIKVIADYIVTLETPKYGLPPFPTTTIASLQNALREDIRELIRQSFTQGEHVHWSVLAGKVGQIQHPIGDNISVIAIINASPQSEHHDLARGIHQLSLRLTTELDVYLPTTEENLEGIKKVAETLRGKIETFLHGETVHEKLTKVTKAKVVSTVLTRITVKEYDEDVYFLPAGDYTAYPHTSVSEERVNFEVPADRWSEIIKTENDTEFLRQLYEYVKEREEGGHYDVSLFLVESLQRLVDFLTHKKTYKSPLHYHFLLLLKNTSVRKGGK